MKKTDFRNAFFDEMFEQAKKSKDLIKPIYSTFRAINNQYPLAFYLTFFLTTLPTIETYSQIRVPSTERQARIIGQKPGVQCNQRVSLCL